MANGMWMGPDGIPFPSPPTSINPEGNDYTAAPAGTNPNTQGLSYIWTANGPVLASHTPGTGNLGATAAQGGGSTDPNAGAGAGTSGAGATTSTSNADPSVNASNFGIIQQYLQQLGITDPSAISWAQGLITSGAAPSQIEVEMYNQPFFKARFPGIFTRQAAGLAPISPADYVAYENSAQQLEHAYGLPTGYLHDPTLIGNLIGKNVSMEQLQGEVEQGFSVVDQAPQAVKDAFTQMYGPAGDSALAAYFIDGDRSLPLLEKQALAAQNMGAGTQQGFAPSQAQAETMAGQGISYSQAQSGFGQLQSLRPYFTPGVGESDQQDINTTGVNAQFGLDSNSQAALMRLESQRKAEFAGGGGAVTTSQGVLGAGSQRPF